MDLQIDLALSLNISITDVDVGDIAAAAANDNNGRRRMQDGATAISFSVTISGDNISTAISSMVDQLNDPTSALMTSPTTGAIDPLTLPTFIFVCPVGMYRPFDEEMCEFCSGASTVKRSVYYTILCISVFPLWTQAIVFQISRRIIRAARTVFQVKHRASRGKINASATMASTTKAWE